MKTWIKRVVLFVTALWFITPFVALGPDALNAVSAGIPQASLPLKYITTAAVTYYLSGFVWVYYWYGNPPHLALCNFGTVLLLPQWTHWHTRA